MSNTIIVFHGETPEQKIKYIYEYKMETWISSQENPIHRFKQSQPWEDSAIASASFEEMTYKISIQKLLNKLLNDKHSACLSAGEIYTLKNLLMKYSQLKKRNLGFLAMNTQTAQMNTILDCLSSHQNYFQDLNKKRKQIAEHIKPKNNLSRKIDNFERKLKNDIDKIDNMNLISHVDNVIHPILTEIKEEQECMTAGLYDKDDGILVSSMKEILHSCMPPLSNGTLDKQSSNIIAEECLKKCFQNEGIKMTEIPLTQYHFPQVPDAEIQK